MHASLAEPDRRMESIEPALTAGHEKNTNG